ncbi:LuxR family transcriptional regulator [Streptomyces griseus]|uniref:HTH luxR-type domain-containing protein n=1 Tax=Streptomyces sp. CMC78 TaxID=3231512 RepID=A0AB33KEA7_9ACTN|nr:LuxR family transcriptional regulator [Streptomyces fimicarius]WTC88278.1 LuxR family transcriptional regulator [Streptomyces griseus]WTD69098.1 LuxR family transcriptional regulator [Streptomyces griseus]
MTRTTSARGPEDPGESGRGPNAGKEPLRPAEADDRAGRDAQDGPAAGQDAIERALLEVRAMIETTVEQHRDRVSWDQLITALDGRKPEVLGEAHKLVLQAATSIDVVLAAGPSCGAEAKAALGDLVRLVPDTVRLRLLCSPAMIDEDFVRRQRERDAPVEVRVARVPPLQAMIVDDSVALVSAESPTGRRASLIRVPDVIRTLCTLYDGVWGNAVTADGRITFGDHSRSDLARQILAALRAGITDEVAARELTVSVRTYRRYVAEIMTLLDASSRFQAGVRAAELGLLGAVNPQQTPQPRAED